MNDFKKYKFKNYIVQSQVDLENKLKEDNFKLYIDYKFKFDDIFIKYPILKIFLIPTIRIDNLGYPNFSTCKINHYVGFNLFEDHNYLNSYTINVLLNFIFLKNRLKTKFKIVNKLLNEKKL